MVSITELTFSLRFVADCTSLYWLPVELDGGASERHKYSIEGKCVRAQQTTTHSQNGVRGNPCPPAPSSRNVASVAVSAIRETDGHLGKYWS